MIAYFFAIFLALMPHNTQSVKATTGTTQVTALDDTGGETEHTPPKSPTKP